VYVYIYNFEIVLKLGETNTEKIRKVDKANEQNPRDLIIYLVTSSFLLSSCLMVLALTVKPYLSASSRL